MDGDFKKLPIIKKEDSYIIPWMNIITNYARIGFEEEISRDETAGVQYRANKGEYLENETKKVLQKMLKNADIFSSVRYSENKRAGETDLLVMYDNNIIIIEIKNRKWKEKSKQGDDYYIQQDLKANIYEAYEQASRTEKYIRSQTEVSFRIADTKSKITIRNTDKFNIYKLGITLENLRTYAVQYYNYNLAIEKDMIFLNINDLKQISNYIEYQTEFIHYLKQRIKCNKYLQDYYFYDELYLFSEYKICNLENILNPRNKFVKLVDIGRYTLYDDRFDKETKHNILRRKQLPFMEKMMRRMEEEKMPGYSTVIMSLLELDWNAQNSVIEGIRNAREQYRQVGKEATSFFTMEEEKELKGLILLTVVSKTKNRSEDIERLGSMYGATIKYKYPSYVVVVCTNYIELAEDYIDNCIYVKNTDKETIKYIEQIPDLKRLYDIDFF